MIAGSPAFLVLKRPNSYGNVSMLQPGHRYLIGRAETNEIVLHDELCSRTHAELYATEEGWWVHDCQSMNGTRVNDSKIEQDQLLQSRDEISLGRSRLIFVTQLADLPPQSTAEPTADAADINIVNRLGQTRYDLSTSGTTPTGAMHFSVPSADQLARHLSLLYRLALKMGEATQFEELIREVLKELIDSTPVDAAAILKVNDRQEVKLAAFQSNNERQNYTPLPPAVLKEVLGSRQAVLAEDRHRLQAQVDAKPRFSSLICCPVLNGERIEFLIHLVCLNPLQTLGLEDLELTVAISRQLGVASQALQRQLALHEENQRLKAQVANEVQLIGQSPSILAIEAQIMRVGPTQATVLIRGESGVGKELVARAIHLASPRRSGPFVCLNCAALAESLLESELFGHEKGAFTGATERKVGKFEASHQGTIFLDEIGELPPTAQAKLLRILEGHPYERVGGNEPVRVNVRVVAATNRPLEEAVNSGLFRKDLYFRLQVVEIRVPSLRERASDIALLAEYFLNRFRMETGHKIRGFTAAAMEKIKEYHWPGNVRELRNVVERALALATGPMLDVDDIWLSNLEHDNGQVDGANHYAPISLEALERKHILETLQFTNWVKSHAAQILQIERSTLDRKIRLYNISR